MYELVTEVAVQAVVTDKTQSGDDSLFKVLQRVVVNVFLDVPTGNMSLQVFFNQEVHSSL